MSIAREHTIRLMSSLGIIGCVAYVADRVLAARAASVSSPNGPSTFWDGVPMALLIVLAAAMAASLLPVCQSLFIRLRRRWGETRFREQARRLASADGQWAVVLVRLQGFHRLPAERRKGATGSLQRYMESFAETGEVLSPLDPGEFGLILRCGEDAVFSRRLSILEQDVGLIFLAAYPGVPLETRVTSCRMDEAGLSDALACARNRLTPKRPNERTPG